MRSSWSSRMAKTTTGVVGSDLRGHDRQGGGPGEDSMGGARSEIIGRFCFALEGGRMPALWAEGEFLAQKCGAPARPVGRGRLGAQALRVAHANETRLPPERRQERREIAH